jgi:hypothetical protein
LGQVSATEGRPIPPRIDIALSLPTIRVLASPARLIALLSLAAPAFYAEVEISFFSWENFRTNIELLNA